MKIEWIAVLLLWSVVVVSRMTLNVWTNQSTGNNPAFSSVKNPKIIN